MEDHDYLVWKRFENHLRETYVHLRAVLRQPNFKEIHPKHYQNMFRDLARSIEEYFDEGEKRSPTQVVYNLRKDFSGW